jgi:4-phytase / acid phosphatase
MKKVCFLAVFLSASLAAAQNLPPRQLKFALILTRHGVRSPTWTADRLNQYSAEPWPEFGVPPGNLTERGRMLIKLMGEFYRQYFSSQKLLGKPSCADSETTYFWADTDQRTLETGRALAEAMIPGCNTTLHSLTADKVDPLFDPIEAGVVKPDPKLGLAAVAGKIGLNLDAVIDAQRPAFDILNRVLNGTGKAQVSLFDQPVALNAAAGGVTMTGPLNIASTFTENLLLEYTNGMRGNQFGWGRLTPSELQQIMVLHTAYADLMRRTPYLARVRGGNLLNYILAALEQAAGEKTSNRNAPPTKNSLVVISGHDTNLSNMSGLLGLSWILPSHQRDDVPPGGALIFSLWDEGNSRYFVRVQFLAQTIDQMHDAVPLSLSNPPAIADVFMPACGTAQDGYACEWTRFRQAVRNALAP